MSLRSDDEAFIRDLWSKPRRVAMLGASPDAFRPSNGVFAFLQKKGHDVIPIHPVADEVHGVPCARNLEEAVERWGSPPDVVDVFRAPRFLAEIVDQTVASGARVLWTQLGVVDDAAIDKAVEADLEVVADRCPKIEIPRLL